MVTIGSQASQTPFAEQPQGGVATAAAPAQGLQVTERAVKRIRVAMAKEGVSPEEGGLRLGVMGGGCSGLSYSIKSIHSLASATAFMSSTACVFLSIRSRSLSAWNDAGL